MEAAFQGLREFRTEESRLHPEELVTMEILPADRTRASYDFRNKQIKV